MESNAPTQSAALAFYTLFSMAPVLLIAMTIAGTLFGEAKTRQAIESQMSKMIGPRGMETVHQVLSTTSRPDLSGWLGVVGVVTLLLGATVVFGQLQEALNEVWGVTPKTGHFVKDFLRKRLLSFGLVIVIGFLLLVSLLLSTALSAISAHLQPLVRMPTRLYELLNFGIFFLLISLLFALIFKVLPDARIAWRDVTVGAVGTALLFSVGKYLIGAYLGQTDTASAFGVAGSLVLLQLWVYYSSMILLLGAGFTRVWSRRHRPPGVVPEPGADAKSAED